MVRPAPTRLLEQAARDETVRARATTAREFDPAEIEHGRRGASLSPITLAALPLAIVVVVNLTMSLVVLPRLDVSFLSQEAWGGTSLLAMAGIWAVIVALAAAIVTVIVVISSGTLDTLPQNGAVVTLFAVRGTSHRESCLDIVMVAIGGATIALVAVIAVGSAFGSF